MSQNVNVNLTPGGYPKEFHVSQYDVGRQLVAKVVDSTGDYSIPSGATVVLVGTKPSGFGFTLNGTVSGSTVTFSTTATVTAEYGRIPCEIRITNGSTILGTANCMLVVEMSPHPEGTTDGDGEQIIPELTLLVQRVEAAAESIHDLSVSATTLPAGSAATATYDEAENSIAFGIPRGADGEVSQAELDAAVSDLKSDLQSLSPLDIYVLDTVTPSGELTNNYAWNVNGSPSAGANYHYKKFDLTQIVGNTVTVSGISWGSIWPLISFYKSDNTLISSYGTTGSTSWNDEEVTVPADTNYAIVNGSNQSWQPNASLSYTGKTGETQQTINEGFTNALQNYIPKLYTLQDAFVAWMNGEKFPIAFYGDSTTDGWRTTDWTANILGSDHTTGYLYTDVLQAHLRECCNNSILRVYNAGFTGRTISWAVSNFEAEFINSGVAYSDVKMIGISFGINDAIGNKSEYTAFKNNLIALIEKCINNNIQPFLVTTQATYEEDPTSRNETIANHSYANQIKKEVARQYNLELIDTEKHTSRFITWSQQRILDIIPDTCHFADAGHKFEGGMYFWQIVPRTIYADESGMIVTPYTIGVTSDIGWRDGSSGMLFANREGSNKFKTVIEVTRENPTDIKMIDTWVYFNKPMEIKPFFGTLGSQYVIVDGASISPNTDEKSIGTFDMGLHHIVLMSGTDETIRCYGYKLV